MIVQEKLTGSSGVIVQEKVTGSSGVIVQEKLTGVSGVSFITMSFFFTIRFIYNIQPNALYCCQK